jgi:hypothetical protein
MLQSDPNFTKIVLNHLKELDVQWDQKEVIDIIKGCSDLGCASALVRERLTDDGVSLALKAGVTV